jgi:hypothetical protein
MRAAGLALAIAVIATGCSKSKDSAEPEGHASIFECVDGRITNTREVATSQLDELETEPYKDCGEGRCALEGKPCPEISFDAAAPAPEPAAIDFDNPDRQCTTDDDCEAIYKWYDTDGACCRGCSTDAVSKSWVGEARNKCSAMGSEGCPLKKCRTLAPVACVEGVCTVGDRP